MYCAIIVESWYTKVLVILEYRPDRKNDISMRVLPGGDRLALRLLNAAGFVNDSGAYPEREFRVEL